MSLIKDILVAGGVATGGELGLLGFLGTPALGAITVGVGLALGAAVGAIEGDIIAKEYQKEVYGKLDSMISSLKTTYAHLQAAGDNTTVYSLTEVDQSSFGLDSPGLVLSLYQPPPSPTPTSQPTITPSPVAS